MNTITLNSVKNCYHAWSYASSITLNWLSYILFSSLINFICFFGLQLMMVSSCWGFQRSKFLEMTKEKVHWILDFNLYIKCKAHPVLFNTCTPFGLSQVYCFQRENWQGQVMFDQLDLMFHTGKSIKSKIQLN